MGIHTEISASKSIFYQYLNQNARGTSMQTIKQLRYLDFFIIFSLLLLLLLFIIIITIIIIIIIITIISNLFSVDLTIPSTASIKIMSKEVYF